MMETKQIVLQCQREQNALRVAKHRLLIFRNVVALEEHFPHHVILVHLWQAAAELMA